MKLFRDSVFLYERDILSHGKVKYIDILINTTNITTGFNDSS
jgi:hypothetical protein